MACVAPADPLRRAARTVPCVDRLAVAVVKLIRGLYIFLRLNSKHCICKGCRVGRQLVERAGSVLGDGDCRRDGLSFLMACITPADSLRRALRTVPCVCRLTVAVTKLIRSLYIFLRLNGKRRIGKGCRVG